MLREDDPRFANWDQDETAVAERYDLQDPVEVSEQILAAAVELADLTTRFYPISGSARGSAPTAHRSRWNRSVGTSSTTRCTTSSTCNEASRR
jgi:hypothetical protein